MGLADRQAMANFKEKHLKAQSEKLAKATGAPIEIEVDEADFNKAATAMLANGCFDRLAQDLTKVCRDAVGKDAIRGSLKRVVVRYATAPKTKSIALADGALTIVAHWDGSPGADFPGYDEYKKYLESAL